MTTDKARKRAVRTRMTKTGERYAAARRQVAGDRPPGPPALPPRVADPGMTDAAIQKRTGTGWDDWFQLLDSWGAVDRSHTEIARFLRDERGVDGWSSQAVTVGYERARGLRALHETSRGFEVSVTRTVAAPPPVIWSVVAEAEGRDRWLEVGLLTERPSPATEGRTARFDVPSDGTRVTIFLAPKGDDRTTVTIAHERLAGPEDIEANRSAWKQRLERLAGLWTSAP